MMERMIVTVVTPANTRAEVPISEASNAMCVYFAIFGDSFDPTNFIAVSNGKVLNPFQPLCQQDVADGSVIVFKPAKTEVPGGSGSRKLVRNTSFGTISLSQQSEPIPLIRTMSQFRFDVHPELVIQRAHSDVPRRPIVRQVPIAQNDMAASSPYFDLILNNSEDELPKDEEMDEEADAPNDAEENSGCENEECANSIMREAMRLNDIGFDKLDLDKGTLQLYQQILANDQSSQAPLDDLVQTESIDPGEPQGISCEPLPYLWEPVSKDDQMYMRFCSSEKEKKLSIEEASEQAHEHLDSHWFW